MRILPILIFLIISPVISSAFGQTAPSPNTADNLIARAIEAIEVCHHWAGEVGGSSDPDRIQDIARGFERDCPKAAELAREAYEKHPDSPVLAEKILILIDFGYFAASDIEKVKICASAAIQIMDSDPYFEALCPGALQAREYKLVKWETELCSCRANVNIKELNPAIITHLVEDFRSFETPKLIDNLDFQETTKELLTFEKERYEQETNENIRRLMDLNLPGTPLIKELHAQTIRGLQVDAHLYLAKLEFLITGNTEGLRKDFLGEKLSPECLRYAGILASKEDTFNALPKFIEKICSNNANPKRCREKILVRTENDFNQAKMEILNFGWHNCANYQFRKNEVYDYTYRVFEEIDRFLIDKVCECDEP